MGTEARWTPTDWLKLVALVGGFCLFALGAWILHLGIAAEGIVDIKSTIVSGTLKTASAGLFICFFAFLVIIFSLVSLYTPSKTGTTAKPGGAKSKSDKLRPFFWALLAGVIFCAIGAAMTEAGARTAFISVGTTLGMGLIFLIAAIVRVVVDEDA
jgi:Mn2+/Fe2+ NRAMP family transporter